MSIGERIKNRRKELQIGADDLAKKLGKNRATIYRYENGDIENLPISILVPIAKALNTNPHYLIGWTSPTEENLAQQRTKQNLEPTKTEDTEEIFEDFKRLSEENQKAIKTIIRNLVLKED